MSYEVNGRFRFETRGEAELYVASSVCSINESTEEANYVFAWVDWDGGVLKTLDHAFSRENIYISGKGLLPAVPLGVWAGSYLYEKDKLYTLYSRRRIKTEVVSWAAKGLMGEERRFKTREEASWFSANYISGPIPSGRKATHTLVWRGEDGVTYGSGGGLLPPEGGGFRSVRLKKDLGVVLRLPELSVPTLPDPPRIPMPSIEDVVRLAKEMGWEEGGEESLLDFIRRGMGKSPPSSSPSSSTTGEGFPWVWGLLGVVAGMRKATPNPLRRVSATSEAEEVDTWEEEGKYVSGKLE